MIQHQPVTRVTIQQDGEYTVLIAVTARGRAVANYTGCEKTENFNLARMMNQARREGIEAVEIDGESRGATEGKLIAWIWFNVIWGLTVASGLEAKQISMMGVLWFCFLIFSYRVPLDWWRKVKG
jgi:hypothetical protein